MRNDQDYIEARLDALERAMHYLRDQVEHLTLMMQAHMNREQ
jgi:chaperonin cofactor prefoldin